MAEIDIYTDVRAMVGSAVTFAGDGTTNGNAIDVIATAPGVAESVLLLGHVNTYAAGELAMVLQESDDNGVTDPWTQVADDEMLPNGGLSGIDATGAFRLGYIGKKQFVREVFDHSGGADFTVQTQFILANFQHQPVPGQSPSA